MRQLKILQTFTDRGVPSLNKYLQDISKVDLLTPDEEFALTRRIKEGDQAALERLIKSNLRFVVSIAKQYRNCDLTLGDLINEGNMGLIKAAYRFDGTRGFKFISYSVWWIRQYILMAIAEKARIVRLPFSQLSELDRVKKAFSKLEQEYEREPSYNEVADYLETTVEKISNSLQHSGNSLSLDSPFKYGEESTLLDILPDNDTQTDGLLSIESKAFEIRQHVKNLPQKEEEIIRLYFGLDNQFPLSLDDISKKFCITNERVRQLKAKALERLSIRLQYS